MINYIMKCTDNTLPDLSFQSRLNRTNIEEQIVASSSASLVNGLNYPEFCLRLQIPQDELSRRLFEIFAVKVSDFYWRDFI